MESNQRGVHSGGYWNVLLSWATTFAHVCECVCVWCVHAFLSSPHQFFEKIKGHMISFPNSVTAKVTSAHLT